MRVEMIPGFCRGASHGAEWGLTVQGSGSAGMMNKRVIPQRDCYGNYETREIREKNVMIF